MYAIRTENLNRRFGKLKAVDSLSLAVSPGTVFGFIGPNGSGKTTTIRLLLGLLDPDEGKAEVLGFDTQKQPDQVRTRCGALLEYNGLYERLSAADNLDYYGRIWHMSKSDRKTRVQQLLTPLELYERSREPIGLWSRGMKQKLAVARTLMHRPELIFLDEPTAGLDPVASAALRDDLRTLAEGEGVTIFLTTHNLADVEKLCGQVGVINHGQLLAMGSPDELRSRMSVPRLSLTGKFPPQAIEQIKANPLVNKMELDSDRLVLDLTDLARSHEIVSLLVLAGAEIDEVQKERANLEEVFLNLVEEESGAEK